MKIQIDTQQKTIAILENCNIEELIKALKAMLGDTYKEYSLHPYTYTYWYSYPWIKWDWASPYIITTGTPLIDYNSGGTSDTKAIYNIEIN
jgi:hypothetical protein